MNRLFRDLLMDPFDLLIEKISKTIDFNWNYIEIVIVDTI